MSDSHEKSDDLIAELARLMASNAKGPEAASDAGAAKLSQPGEAATPQPGPVRIPGMEAPSVNPPESRPTPAVGAVRIPGVQIDFGKAPVAPPIAAPEPLSTWMDRAKPVTTEAPQPQAPEKTQHSGFGETGPQSQSAAPLIENEGIDFGRDDAQSGPGGRQQGESKPDHDPIAHLIAADDNGGKPANMSFAGQPASVEAIPARNFGHVGVEAPVLIARPSSMPPRPPVGAPDSPAPDNGKPQQSGEGDRFGMPPVFGLGSRPATPPEPVRGGDPMDEIENLIGGDNADISPPVEQVVSPTQTPPAVPPLMTRFAPRRAAIKDDQPNYSAEAAILAAAAATGAEVDRIEPSEDIGAFPPAREERAPVGMRAGGRRQYFGLAVAGTLLLAAGFGLYWVLGTGTGDPANAPVLTADDTPARQAPVATADSAEPERSVVFDEIDGVAATGSGETLVSRDETAGTTPAEVARVVTPAGADSTESGLANRKVRTVTVRPDGTIVDGEEAIAGAAALPVDRPDVPELPGGEAAPSDLLQAATAAPLAPVEADPIAAIVADNAAAPGAATATTEPAPLEVAAATPAINPEAVLDPSLVAPVPMPRPADRSRMAGAASAEAAPVAVPAPLELVPNTPAATPLAAVAEPATATAAPAASGTAAVAYVQLSSSRAEGDAQASARSAESNWSSLFQGNALEIQRADVPERGIFYRVRLPATSLEQARQICASIKSSGGDCIAING